MGWQTAIVGAMGAAQIKSQGVIGDFNQAVNNRNAEVLENQAKAIDQKAEFDIKQFDKEFVKLVGSSVVATVKSGVTYGDTALRIAKYNQKEKVLEDNLIRYNAKMNIAQKNEEAAFAKIRGDIAKQTSRFEQIKTAGSYGSSLLTMTRGTNV